MRIAALALGLALATAPALAQVLYKWTDASGKVVYSDRPPPKGFKGPVEKIEPDAAPTPTADPISVEPRSLVPRAGSTPPADLAARRREKRERLQARVDAAQDKVEAARRALAESENMTSEDRRTFVQRVPGPPEQVVAKRSNCKVETDANTGKKVAVCTTSTPSEAYNERVAKLEEALRTAESELDQAKEAYRRGVD